MIGSRNSCRRLPCVGKDFAFGCCFSTIKKKPMMVRSLGQPVGAPKPNTIYEEVCDESVTTVPIYPNLYLKLTGGA